MSGAQFSQRVARMATTEKIVAEAAF